MHFPKKVVSYFLLLFFLFFYNVSFAGYDLGENIDIRILSKEKLSHVQIWGKQSEVLISVGELSNYTTHEPENSIISVNYENGSLRVVTPSMEVSSDKIFIILNDESNGLLTIKSPKTGIRKYRGFFILKIFRNQLIVINRIHMEHYLYGVVPGEMSANWKLEALKAQAIVSRTFAYKNLGRHKNEGYDFCDLTHCQSYKGYDYEKTRTNWAVDGTRSKIICYNGNLIDAYYHSTCGGKTSNSTEIWGMEYNPYLISVDDTINGEIACIDSPHFSWSFTVSKKKLFGILQNYKNNTGAFFTNCSVNSKFRDNRVEFVSISGDFPQKISGWEFRRILCKQLGWNSIKSSNFDITDKGDNYIFTGNGLGHGLGMCQYGCLKRAESGKSAAEILMFYFPGSTIKYISDCR